MSLCHFCINWYHRICLTMFLSKYPTWFWKIYPSPTSLNIDSTHLIHLKVCWFCSFKDNINLYKMLLNFDSLWISLLQKDIILSLTLTSIGNLLGSPRTIKLAVIFLTWSTLLHYFRWICSINFKFSYPHASEP